MLILSTILLSIIFFALALYCDHCFNETRIIKERKLYKILTIIETLLGIVLLFLSIVLSI